MLLKVFLKNALLLACLVICETSYGVDSHQEANSRCRLEEAKKIILDALPGEGVYAEKLLINCIRAYPKYLEPILELARYIEQKVSLGEKPVFEIHKSIALVSQAYSIAPDSPRVRYMMAHMLRTIGEYEESQNLYEKTLEVFPYDKDTLIEKAKMLMEKNPQESLTLITESIKMGTEVDDVVDVILNSVRLKSDQNQYSQSLALVAQQFQNRWLFHKLGLVLIDENQYTQAESAFKRAIELGSKVESKLQLAIVQYKYLKDYKNSILNFESLIKEIEQNQYIQNSSQSLVYSHYSLALFLNHKIPEASNAAIQATLKGIGKRDYIQSLVYEYKSKQGLYVLQPALEFVTLNDPTFDLGHAFLGEIYKETKNYTLALEAFDKAITLNPKNDSFYAIRGAVYYKTYDYENALNNFDYALKLSPGTPAYIYNKACVLALMGKKKESLIYLKIALSSDKSFIDIAKKDPDFTAIKSDENFSKEFASLLFQNYDNKWAADTDLKNKP